MKRPLLFGETLFDRFPDGGAVLGGAPFNVAWNLQAFGAEPLFLTRIGDDRLGEQVREAFATWGLDDAGLQVDPERPTGTVEVSLEGDGPSYEIKTDTAMDRIAAMELPGAAEIALLYHGTLALRDPVSRRSFDELIAGLDAPRFIDVNLRAPHYDGERVARLLEGATWVKLSEEEQRMLGLGEGEGDAKSARARLGLRSLVVTLGARGAFAVTDGETLRVSPSEEVAVVDTVGAGDAFVSVLILGELHGWAPAESLQRAQAFAGGVIGLRGATTVDRAFYARYARAWGLAP